MSRNANVFIIVAALAAMIGITTWLDRREDAFLHDCSAHGGTPYRAYGSNTMVCVVGGTIVE